MHVASSFKMVVVKYQLVYYLEKNVSYTPWRPTVCIYNGGR